MVKIWYLHRVVTPLPQSASSRCKSRDPSYVSLGIPGAPRSRLRLSSLWSWFCGSTMWPNSFVVNRRKPHEKTPVVSRYPAPAHVHNFVLLFLPPRGPHLIPFGHQVHRAKPTCLSTPRRPRKAKTFRVCSSLAPTQIKSQPAPVILDQESIHTMLSITHHTRERPFTGPPTLRSSKLIYTKHTRQKH
jgi:hypothetical protein